MNSESIQYQKSRFFRCFSSQWHFLEKYGSNGDQFIFIYFDLDVFQAKSWKGLSAQI